MLQVASSVKCLAQLGLPSSNLFALDDNGQSYKEPSTSILVLFFAKASCDFPGEEPPSNNYQSHMRLSRNRVGQTARNFGSWSYEQQLSLRIRSILVFAAMVEEDSKGWESFGTMHELTKNHTQVCNYSCAFA